MPASHAASRSPPTAPGILRRLGELAGDTAPLRVVVAWSGGLDSTVLLHALCQADRRRVRLRAVHVDHDLQPAAADFRRFCRHMARQWQVPLRVMRVSVPRRAGDSLEAAARDARRAALAATLRPGELLLLAQHADDQLETVLFALLRGAGPAGLAGMPAAMPFGAGRLLRPLLDFDRAGLQAYASQHGLSWVEDPTNSSLQFDRNYLRAEVLPALRRRWPAAAATVARSAGFCADAALGLARAAQRDLESAADGADLEVAVLRRWQPARRAHVLRAWIQAHGYRAPEARHLQQVEALIDARADALPMLRLPQFDLRRHDGRLMLSPPRPASSAMPALPPIQRWDWRKAALMLADGSTLRIRRDAHGDMDLQRLPRWLMVGFAAAAPGRSLRKRFQQLDVPQWQRAHLPLLFAPDSQAQAGQLLAIADLWLDADIRSAGADAVKGRIFWQAPR